MTAVASTSADATESARLLLVEDDVGIGRLLERGLRAEGFDVSWVRDLRGGPDAV